MLLSGAVEAFQSAASPPRGESGCGRRGKIVYLQAFGQRDREANAPMPEDAIFRIASQTKRVERMFRKRSSLLIKEFASKYLARMSGNARQSL